MKLFKNEKGQSLVEWALILPMVILFILALFEISLIINKQLIIGELSREVNRGVTLLLSEAELVTMATNISDGITTISSSSVQHTPTSTIISLNDVDANTVVTVTIEPSLVASVAKGDSVQVSASYTHTFNIPFISQTSIQLSSVSESLFESNRD